MSFTCKSPPSPPARTGPFSVKTTREETPLPSPSDVGEHTPKANMRNTRFDAPASRHIAAHAPGSRSSHPHLSPPGTPRNTTKITRSPGSFGSPVPRRTPQRLLCRPSTPNSAWTMRRNLQHHPPTSSTPHCTLSPLRKKLAQNQARLLSSSYSSSCTTSANGSSATKIPEAVSMSPPPSKQRLLRKRQSKNNKVHPSVQRIGGRSEETSKRRTRRQTSAELPSTTTKRRRLLEESRKFLDRSQRRARSSTTGASCGQSSSRTDDEERKQPTRKPTPQRRSRTSQQRTSDQEAVLLSDSDIIESDSEIIILESSQPDPFDIISSSDASEEEEEDEEDEESDGSFDVPSDLEDASGAWSEQEESDDDDDDEYASDKHEDSDREYQDPITLKKSHSWKPLKRPAPTCRRRQNAGKIGVAATNEEEEQTDDEDEEDDVEEYFGVTGDYEYADEDLRTESMTKACFVFVPREEQREEQNLFKAVLEDETTEYVDARWHCFESAWNAVQDEIKKMQREFDHSALSGIATFVQTQHTADAYHSTKYFLRNANEEVPVAVVVTGMNTADHVEVWNRIVQYIETPVEGRSANSCLTVRLRSQDAQTVDHLMSQLINRLIALKPDGKTKKISRRAWSFDIIEEWYGHVQRKYYPSDSSPNLVVVCEDFEAFVPGLLDALIELCGDRAASIPFVLVFGVNLAIHPLSANLSRRACAVIRTETFYIDNPEQHFDEVVRRVLVRGAGFLRLGPRPLDYFLDHFERTNRSLDPFVRGLEFAFLEHFSTQPLSFLVQSRHAAPKPLTDFHLEYLETKVPSTRDALRGKTTTQTKRLVEKWLSDIRRYNDTFPVVFESFAHLATLEQSFGDVYFTVLNSARDMTNVIDDVLDRESVRSELAERASALAIMDHMQTCLSRSVSPRFEQAQKSIATCIEVLSTGESQALERTHQHQLREWIRQFFRTFLISYQALPMHETFFFEAPLGAALNPRTRARALKTALKRPFGTYLPDNPSCGRILPDLCVLYKFYEESGTMINLHDWYQQFASFVRRQRPERARSERCHRDANSDEEELVETELTARFVRGVTEMQFLGLVQRTRRKPDHVLRCVFEP